VNFSWFASAYDNDDVVYRCLVFLQMIGALIVAVGIKEFTEGHLTILPLAGYIVMRIGMICLWLRAARDNPETCPSSDDLAQIGLPISGVSALSWG